MDDPKTRTTKTRDSNRWHVSQVLIGRGAARHERPEREYDGFGNLTDTSENPKPGTVSSFPICLDQTTKTRDSNR
jgi:hypothetical protein